MSWYHSLCCALHLPVSYIKLHVPQDSKHFIQLSICDTVDTQFMFAVQKLGNKKEAKFLIQRTFF
jgi:hypothetical protein